MSWLPNEHKTCTFQHKIARDKAKQVKCFARDICLIKDIVTNRTIKG